MQGSSNRKVNITTAEIALIWITCTLESFQTIFYILVFTELPSLVFDFVISVYSISPIKNKKFLFVRVCPQSHHLMSSNAF